MAATASSPAAEPLEAGRIRRRRAEGLFALGLLGPALTIIALLFLVPLVLLAFISFKAVKLGSLAQIFTADATLANYAQVLSDPATWSSLLISVYYVVGSSLLAFVLGLWSALLLNEKFPAQRLFRTLILLPWAVPGITATIAFLWMLQPSFGVVNFILRELGLVSHDVEWFGDPNLALFAVTMPTVWKTYPFFTIMLLAALQTIPRELYEAASIDGAARWHRFRWITWPGIRPYAAIALLFNGMHVFREFDFIYASTRGGPRGATTTVAIRIYNVAFESFNLAAAAALGILTFVLLAVCVLGFVRWQMREVTR
jgi:multiple sugar transport system permease protein